MVKKAYVLGGSTSKSLSPVIFKKWFVEKKIDANYGFKEFNSKHLKKELKKTLNEKNLCGLNITIPHKEKIIPLLEKIDLHAKKIGAVNCVYRFRNKWIGTNTDWIGFSKAIESHHKIKKETAVVIGYGGASKAIIYSLLKEGFKEIKIFNRSVYKIKHLNNKNKIKYFALSSLPDHTLKANLIVNTTPVNIFENFKLINISKNTYGFDIVYKPRETKFLSYFNKSKRIYGISMLVYQAEPCFVKWFKVRPTINNKFLKSLEVSKK